MMNEFEKHPQLASYITEMKDSGQIPADFDKFLSCLNESLKPKSRLKTPIEERKRNFIESLRPHLDEFGKDLLNEFVKYWIEPNKSGTSMRFESEKFWDLKRRLNTFKKNGFGKSKPIVEKEEAVAGRMTQTAINNSLKNFMQ